MIDKNHEERNGRMTLRAKAYKRILRWMNPHFDRSSYGLASWEQERAGDALYLAFRGKIKRCRAEDNCIFLVPKEKHLDGILLYLHGGGYVAGGAHFARGVAAMYAAKLGMEVCAVAYRKAPEFPYPAAREDCIRAYHMLQAMGYERIILCGESAGGGLAFSLCEEKTLAPAGVIALSPWTDLTASGESYQTNRTADPSLTESRLLRFTKSYASGEEANPEVSPLFADVSGFPPTQIYVGGDEILLDDARRMHEKLLAQGIRSELTVRDGLWHGYLLYLLPEGEEDFAKMRSFLATLP